MRFLIKIIVFDNQNSIIFADEETPNEQNDQSWSLDDQAQAARIEPQSVNPQTATIGQLFDPPDQEQFYSDEDAEPENVDQRQVNDNNEHNNSELIYWEDFLNQKLPDETGQGDKGQVGEPGDDAPHAPNGIIGIPGVDDTPGNNGAPGKNGESGDRGKQGFVDEAGSQIRPLRKRRRVFVPRESESEEGNIFHKKLID